MDDTAAIEDSHSQLAAQMDDSSNRFDAQNDLLSDWNRRVLSAVEAQYGPDSSEYEMVGGTRKSERKRPIRKGPAGGSKPNPLEVEVSSATPAAHFISAPYWSCMFNGMPFRMKHDAAALVMKL